jgi:hypothetical protein
MSGEMFADYEFVKTLIEKTSTKNGLKVFVRLNCNYEIITKCMIINLIESKTHVSLIFQ